MNANHARSLLMCGAAALLAAPAASFAQSEACCLPNGSCSFTSTFLCGLLGGVSQGPGTTCSPNPCINEACCLPNGSCAAMSNFDCIINNGNPQGPGSTCPHPACPGPQPEACCLPNGSCLDLDPPTCGGIGGLSQGPGTFCPFPACACTCPGDVNQDGSVDAADIQGFVACVVTGAGGANCACGDLDGSGTTDVADIVPFVVALLAGPGCA